MNENENEEYKNLFGTATIPTRTFIASNIYIREKRRKISNQWLKCLLKKNLEKIRRKQTQRKQKEGNF